MNIKRKILSIMLVLVIIVSPVFSGMPALVLADTSQILKIDNEKFYKELKDCLSSRDNEGALISTQDENREITLDMAKVTKIEMKPNMSVADDNFNNVLTTLLEGCTNLIDIRLSNCDLRGIDLATLRNRENLTGLYLIRCHIDKVPDLAWNNLKTLCLTENDLSAVGACDSLTKENFPKLTTLWLDTCQISDIDFIENLGNLKNLSLADNQLTNDSITALTQLTNLSDLQRLYLGARRHSVVKGMWSYSLYISSKNKFTDPEDLASLTERFPMLQELDLSGLRIVSLQAFTNIRDDVEINFQINKITDFAGLESNKKFDLSAQYILLSGNFAAGLESELPELVKRILDQEDVLAGDLEYTNCRLSDDGSKIVIPADANTAFVKVRSGRFYDSQIVFHLKKIPDYTTPQGITATEGDTLAAVVLPEGFAWKDSELDVGTAGTHIFKAIYTPQDTDTYVYIDNIDVPVTVKASATEPVHPTPTPEVPTPTPEAPTPTPEVPTPTPAPPTPTPEAPTLIPEETKQPSIIPTPKPDESKMSGNEIEKRKDLSLLLAAGKQKGSSGIKLTWRKKNGCSGYEVYWSYCDGKQNYKKLKTVGSSGKRECIHKKLKKDRAYKYYIATYTIKEGRKNYQSKSPVIHVAMKREKHTNAKRIKVKKAKVLLKEKKTIQIKATAVLENRKKKLLNHDKKFRYYVDNKDVVSVDKTGKIKAKNKGICSVFVIANNGVAKQIKVTVK